METKFGQRLAELRKDENMSREDLANELSMSINTLRNYENGSREPGHKFVMLMANRFDTTTDYLLGLSNIRYKKAPESADTDLGALTSAEKHLIKNLRNLNNDGQEKLLDYSDDLVASGRYIIDNSIANMA